MNALRTIGRTLKALHRDEQGADLVEYILIIAAIALPLLGVIIWFWKDLAQWVGNTWNDVQGDGYETNPDDLNHD